jgi:hypothetical protein
MPLLMAAALALAMVPVGASVPQGPASAGDRAAPVLDPDERLLVPASDLLVSGVEAVGIGSGPLFRAVADAASPIGADEATHVVVQPGQRTASHRVGLSRAPSGNVTDAVVRYRAAATAAPTTVSVRLYDADEEVAVGPAHPLAPGEGWVDLEDRFGDLSISRAERLGVEVRFESGADGVGSGRYASLAVEVRLRVSLAFRSAPLQGGGTMTALVLPSNHATVLAGSADAGLYRSGDGGRTFQARNLVMKEPYQQRIAALSIHPQRPRVAYAAGGSQGEDSFLLRTSDDGRTWSVITGIPRFSATDNGGPLKGRPRSVGNLLAFRDDRKGVTTIWAATFGGGLMRSADGGGSWEVVGLEGRHLRGLAQHPRHPETLAIATLGAGTWVTHDASAPRPTFTHLTGGPVDSEEVAFVGETLFVAGGREGLYRAGDRGLERVNDGVPLGAADWNGLAGYRAAARTVILASCNPCQPDADGGYASIIRSLDGGESWQSVTDASSVTLDIAGRGEPWTLAQRRPGIVPGSRGFRPYQLAIRPPPTGRIDGGVAMVAAEGGLWRSVDDGATWAPAVDGLGGLDARGVTGDPADPDRLAWGIVGLGGLSSEDGVEAVTLDSLGPDVIEPLAVPVAYATAFDTTTAPSTMLVAVGDAREPAGTVVEVGPDAGSPRDLGFASDVPGKRPTAIAVGRDEEGRRVLLATAHPGGGIVRKVGDGPWTRADAGDAYAGEKTIARADLAWVRGTGVVYLYDPGTGVHRSTDAGLSWTLIYANRSNRSGTSALAATDDPDVLFVASDQGVQRLDGASTGTVGDRTIGLTQLGTFRRASDLALDRDGRLWVASGILHGSPPRLAVSWDPDSDEPTFHDLATERYVNTAIRPDSIHVTRGGVVVADQTFGLLVGRLSDVVVEPWLPPDIVLHSLELGEGSDAPMEAEDPAVTPPLVEPFRVYLAEDGDDARSGLAESEAVLTLSRAQDILRERFGADAGDLDRDVLVLVRSGRYVGQSTVWTFAHPSRVVRIAGYGDGPAAAKPTFVGCAEGSCASARTWFVLEARASIATNVQLVNLRVAKYLRAIAFQGSEDRTDGWNGFNVIHRCGFDNIGTRFRADITPEVWSPAIVSLVNSRSNLIVGNRFAQSSNRMDHANPWFHLIYASHGASDNRIASNLIVDTSGDFHLRDGSDRNAFVDNVIEDSFDLALVTDWGSEVETESCDTEVSGNIWIGDWYCELEDTGFERTTPSPDGRCAREGLADYVVRARNEHRPAGASCTPS